MVLKKIFNLSNLTLLTALVLSGIAAWYSILGLTAIFAAAVVPIIVMGGSLEFAKVVTTVWLHRYWDRVSLRLKLYLVPAVVALAFLTSMGIFGFLSKAHSDQSLISGDSQAKVAIYDEKIKTAKENIEADRKQLKQLDEAVDQVMARSTTEQGADKSVAIRKAQARDRSALAKSIEANQKLIATLNNEAAPIRAEVRKVEAEVGPIKYIAALIYGDNPDSNLLERAVRWVIILIVFVFDPLALTLVVASNSSREWDKEIKEEPKNEPDEVTLTDDLDDEPEETVRTDFSDIENSTPWPTEWQETEPEVEINEKTHPYLYRTGGGFKNLEPMVYKPEVVETIEPQVTEVVEEQTEPVEPTEPLLAEITETVDATSNIDDITTEGVTREIPYEDLGNGYIIFEGKQFRKDALAQIHPELFAHAIMDIDPVSHSGYGRQFPKIANRGDSFVRVDTIPNRIYKFDGFRWVHIPKDSSDSYLHNKSYLQFLVSKIDTGEYDIEGLTDIERSHLEEYLRSQNS